jgi:hypothetical protein
LELFGQRHERVPLLRRSPEVFHGAEEGENLEFDRLWSGGQGDVVADAESAETDGCKLLFTKGMTKKAELKPFSY